MKNHKISHSWVVVGAALVILTVAFSIQTSFGVFIKPLQDSFGWSRATTSWAITVHLLIYALFLIPAGWAIDRFNMGVVFSVAAGLIAFALVLCSRISEPWQLYLLYGLPLGIGIAICGPPILGVLTRWFAQRRGTALGIAATGTGFGTLLGAPIANALIGVYGWQGAFLIFGIAGSIILLICAYIVRGPARPTELETKAMGSDSQGRANPLPRPSMGFAQALKTPQMRLLVITQFFAIFTTRVVPVHIVPHAIDMGISPSVAALSLATIGAFSVVGRLSMGVVQDKIGPRYSMIICLFLQVAAMVALPFIGTEAPLFVFAAVFGYTWGGDVPQIPAMTAQCFGLASVGVLYAAVMMVGNVSGSISAILAGYIFDVTGSYTVIFLAAAAGLLVGIFCIWRLKLPEN
ncbi:MAG: MFS transporter [Dehalococcoidales bacterium]|nr:MFS transporter [Dehalococcoidales bacterium]